MPRGAGQKGKKRGPYKKRQQIIVVDGEKKTAYDFKILYEEYSNKWEARAKQLKKQNKTMKINPLTNKPLNKMSKKEFELQYQAAANTIKEYNKTHAKKAKYDARATINMLVDKDSYEYGRKNAISFRKFLKDYYKDDKEMLKEINKMKILDLQLTSAQDIRDKYGEIIKDIYYKEQERLRQQIEAEYQESGQAFSENEIMKEVYNMSASFISEYVFGSL